MINYIASAIAGIAFMLAIRLVQLSSQIDDLQAKLVVSQTNEYTMTKTVQSQNEQINKVKVDLENKTAEYVRLLNQPPEIRYEVVYKKVPTIEVKSDECADIKKLIDDIRAAGY